MQKLLHNSFFWCVMFLVGSGLSLWFLVTYPLRWYRADPGYLDLMASAVVTVLIVPFFIIAIAITARAVLSTPLLRIELAMAELTAKASPQRRSTAKS